MFSLAVFVIFISGCKLAPVVTAPVDMRPIENKHKPYTVNVGAKGEKYYHLMYALSPDNLHSVERFSQEQFIDNGGQFELKLNRTAFPISAPNCQDDIVLRMPWVPSKVDVRQKYQLYQAILAMFETKQGEVKVAIELNPYVEISSEGLQLQHCNIFFRHAHTQYVPHIKALN